MLAPMLVMDPTQPMMLPKGIVINNHSIYDEVARYSNLPMDKIWKIWQVYTTTNKKLKDPTARRLENFWWHVLGSDRHNLSGRALAKLYQEISLGPTFVPLKGPLNRWEPQEASPNAAEALPNETGPVTLPTANTGPTSQIQSASPSKGSASSASKPPPPHPILKKSRGPSSSGPRPTARFVSPHESADEAEQDGNALLTDSASAIASAPPLPTPHPTPKKKATKKYVASSASSKGSKRRPVLSRRASSQSSTNSDATGTSVGSRTSGSVRPVSPIPEKPSTSTTPQSHESSSAVPPPGMSAKAAGKRPAISSNNNSTAGKGQAQHAQKPPQTSRKCSPLASKPDLPPSTSPQAVISQVQSMIDLTSHRRRSSQPPIIGTNATLSSSYAPAPPAMSRSSSHTGQGRAPSAAVNGFLNNRPLSSGLFTKSTAATTTVAAQGTIIDQSGVGSLPISGGFDGLSYERNLSQSQRTNSSSFLDARMTPTQPSTSVNVPLGRTKSQLNLLLEREKLREAK